MKKLGLFAVVALAICGASVQAQCPARGNFRSVRTVSSVSYGTAFAFPVPVPVQQSAFLVAAAPVASNNINVETGRRGLLGGRRGASVNVNQNGFPGGGFSNNINVQGGRRR
jgi:hypothetical protein